MKRYFVLGVLCLIVLLLFSACTQEESGYRKQIPAYTRDVSEDDGVLIVSGPHVYEKKLLENPGGYHIGSGLESKIFFRDGHLMIPVDNWHITGNFGVTVLEYDADGTLLSETVVPYFDRKSMSVIDVYPTRDGRFVYYSHRGNNQYETFLMIADGQGKILYEVDLPRQEVSCISAASMDLMGMHVSERDGGSLRIFINAWNEAYLYDETLSLLQSVPLYGDHPGIHMESEGVYVIGREMPLISRVDMNTGTFSAFDYTDLPVQPGMIYDCRIYYGADGQMYCEHEKVLYRCDGGGTMTEVMRWEEGTENGNGQIYIMDASSVYYLPLKRSITSVVRLDIRENTLMDERQVLTLVNLGSAGNSWLSEMIAQFNVTNPAYYVELKHYSRGFVADGEAKLREDMLSGHIPDLVVSDFRYDLKPYFDKGILTDLSAEFGALLPDGVRNASLYRGKLYTLPLSFQLYTFVSLSDTLDAPLTWEKLYDMEADLLDGGCRALHTSDSATYMIGDHIAVDFYDADAKSVSFDSEAYHRRVEFIQRFSSDYLVTDYGEVICSDMVGGRYVLTAPYIKDALLSGDVKLLNVHIRTMEAFSALKLLFGEHPYTLCGYPSDEGIGANLVSNMLISASADSDMSDGCREFIRFLLSDDAQCHDGILSESLPAARSALRAAMDLYRYFYYGDGVFRAEPSAMIGGMQTTNISLAADAHTAQYDAQRAQTASQVIEITDDDRAEIMHFFDELRCPITDPTIAEIVTEELSAWEGGARSLGETAKIIDSRVWLYLNE
ncbi:MAG: hypothetical protein E7604_05150 [Ruminococcaceae bacterium]|nr:hypothetical protein [Oscillospiraceae bacterium]